MPLSSSNAARQLSDGNSQGTVLGQSVTDLIGFYGVTPTAKDALFSTVSSQSISSGALAANLAAALNSLGLINCSTVGA